MEVGAIGQGGQVFPSTKNASEKMDKMMQTDNTQYSDTLKVSDNSKDNVKDNFKEKDVKKAVDKLNKFLEDNKTHAEYEIHDKFKDVMIKIVDDKSGEIIQELPPKKILDMVAKMCEMVGVLFDKKA